MFANRDEVRKIDKRIDKLEEKVELAEVSQTMDINKVIMLFENLLIDLKKTQEKTDGKSGSA